MRELTKSGHGCASALIRMGVVSLSVAVAFPIVANAQSSRPQQQQTPSYRTEQAPQVRSAPQPVKPPEAAPAAQAPAFQAPAARAPAAPTAKAPSAATSLQNSSLCMNDDKSIPVDKAIGGCDAVIQETAKNLATAYYLRGVAHRSKNDYDSAIADFGQAVALDAREPEYLTQRAASYEGKKDFDRAVADYDQALKINPKFVDALNNRGAAYQRKGDYARATADYGEITKLQPTNADAWAARCWVRAIGGREVQQALADCNESLKIKSDSADVLDTRGFAYLKLGQADAALKDYEAALKINPKLAGSLYGRGLIKQKKGDRAGGQADIAAAKAARSDIAEEFTRYGVK